MLSDLTETAGRAIPVGETFYANMPSKIKLKRLFRFQLRLNAHILKKRCNILQFSLKYKIIHSVLSRYLGAKHMGQIWTWP